MGIGKLFGSSKPTPQKKAAGAEQDDLGKLFAVLEIAPDGKILAANARACDLYGLGKAALLDKTYDELLPADGPNAANVLATAGSSGGEPIMGQRTSGGGQVINVKARFLPVKGPDNKIRSYREVSYKSEGSTSSAHDVAWKFTALSRSLAIIEFEPTGVILWANDNFLGAMGYQLHEIQGNHHSMFVSDEIKNSHEYKSFWDDLKSGEFKSDAFERKGKGGTEIWIQATYNPVFDDDGNVVKVIKAATDITSHRSAQKTISDCLQLLSEGKLEARIPGDIDQDFATIRNTFNSSMDRLAEMISKIKETGTRIAQESEAVGQSAYDLSRRTEGQAAALEETSASMDEIANKVAENSANAKRTTEIATNATERSQRGGKIVTDAVQAMSRIEESSTKVSEIVSVIEAIAFQTNLLALNAAVEAARAGDAGKGFAVVAAEVRSLAQRSSEAAKDIAELIQRSVGEVNDGAQLVRQTGSALDEITSSFEDMRDSVNDITEASVAQSNSVNEIRHAIKGLDDRTQQNAGMAEQSVSYATTLGELVAELKALTEYFSGDGIPAISAAGGTDVQMFDDDNEDWQAKMPMQGAA